MLESTTHASLYSAPDSDDPRDWYLHLLELCLTGLLAPKPVTACLQRPSGEVRMEPTDPSQLWLRYVGGEVWPADSFTMIGVKRLQNIRFCIEDVLDHNVPGDLIETGVWRGGAAIFMRALLKVHSVLDRVVVGADSFEGLPPPNAEAYPADRSRNLHKFRFLAVALEEVKENFEKFGLLDDQVQFVKGWFRDTLPTLSDRTWSVIRLDGDLYESTINALENLYPNLSPGGFLIVDDYGIAMCREAVNDYRESHGIAEEVHAIDKWSVFWQKAR